MMAKRLSRGALLLLALLALGPLSACGSDGGEDPLDPGSLEELRPLIGTWRAQSLVHTSKADPSTSLDLIQDGASFTFRVTESGRYEATLELFGNFFPEEGRISVSGSTLTLDPDGSDNVDTAEWRVEGNTLFLSGDSNFDFNLDGETVPTTLDVRLNRI